AACGRQRAVAGQPVPRHGRRGALVAAGQRCDRPWRRLGGAAHESARRTGAAGPQRGMSLRGGRGPVPRPLRCPFWSEPVTEPCKALLASALCVALAGMASTARAALPDGSPSGAQHVAELAPTTATLDLGRTVAMAVAWHPSVRSAAS